MIAQDYQNSVDNERRAFYTDNELVVARYLTDHQYITDDEIEGENTIVMSKKYVVTSF